MVQMQCRAGRALPYWVPLLPAVKYRNAGIGNISVSYKLLMKVFSLIHIWYMVSHQLSVFSGSSGFTVLLKDCWWFSLPFYQVSSTRTERKFSGFYREAKQKLLSWNLTKIALHNYERSAVSLHSFVLEIFRPVYGKYLNRKILCRRTLWKSC